jgi:serine/threonine protein phosphatase 1
MERPEGDKGKIFAVGDIHGCYEKLISLMDRLPFDRHTDMLIFIGDYINRGPQSREVIDYLLELRRKCKKIIFLMGNHEHALLQYAQTKDREYLRLLRAMEVESTLKSYLNADFRSLSDLGFLPLAHRDFINGLLPYYRTGKYLFIHAGVIPGENPEECSLDRLLTVRDTFLECEPEQDLTVVFGHTPFEMPFVAPGRIGIDTGAGHGNMLTAVLLPDLHFFHA